MDCLQTEVLEILIISNHAFAVDEIIFNTLMN